HRPSRRRTPRLAPRPARKLSPGRRVWTGVCRCSERPGVCPPRGLGFSRELSYAGGRTSTDRGGFSMLACKLARFLRGSRPGSGLGGVTLPALVAGVSLVPALALAQEPAEEAAAAEPPEPAPHIDLTGNSPRIDLSTPPPPARVERKFRQHEGFYVRVGGGLGTL